MRALSLFGGILIGILLVINACNTNGSHPTLLQAEKLMNERPDSALLLLENSALSTSLSGKAYADWCLLLTMARDKNYMDHTSDSLIRIAVGYYEEKEDSERLLLSYYMMGRVLQELNMAPQAQEYYLKAMEIGKDSKDYALMARLCNNLGMLYTRQRVYDEALTHMKKGLDYLRQAGETASQSFVLRDIGRTYRQLNQLNSAEYYYQNALIHSSTDSEYSILRELASVLSDKKDYESAISYSYQSLQAIQNPSEYDQTYYILGKVYLAMNQMDSASFYLHKSMNSSVLETKASSYHQLYHLAKAKNDLPTFAALQGQYELLRDSIQKRKDKEATLRVQSLYDYQQIVKEAESIKLLHTSSQRNIYRLSFLLCITILCMVGLFFLYKNYQKNKENQLELKLKTQTQNHHLSLAEKGQAIKQLEAIHADKINTLNNRLSLHEHQIEELKKLKNNLLNVKEEFGLFIPFHTELLEGKKLSAEQWIKLLTWINIEYSDFTQRLKMVCPRLSEFDVKVCCLVRIDIPPMPMSAVLSKSDSGIYKAKQRIYNKLTKKNGTAGNLSAYLSDF